MRTAIILVLAIVSATCGAADDAAALERLLDVARTHSPASDAGMRARIVAVSAALRGRGYATDPLGEGDGGSVDRDPLLRFDVFDCVTYVETVLAIARATRAGDVPAALQAIRYRGAVSYQSRNHLPTADWLPNAVDKHIVAEATRSLFPDLVLGRISIAVDRDRALQALARRNHAPPPAREFSAPASATIDYLPARSLRDPKLLARIPTGTLVMVVAPQSRSLERLGIGEAVTHFGIAVREGSGPLLLRAATPVKPARVRDVDLAGYARRNPRVLGFVFLAPLPP